VAALDAARARRAARAAASSGGGGGAGGGASGSESGGSAPPSALPPFPPPPPPLCAADAAAEADLLAWLALGGLDEHAEGAHANAPGANTAGASASASELDAELAALLGDALLPLPLPLPRQQPHADADVASSAVTPLTVSLKLRDGAPDALPPWLAHTLRSWAGGSAGGGDALALCGAVQPGCTLLTVDILLPAEAMRAEGAAAALRDAMHAAAHGAPLPAMRFAVGADAADDGGDDVLAPPARAPRLRQRVVHVPRADADAVADARRVVLALAAPPAAPLRCRAHGALLPLTTTSASASASATHTHTHTRVTLTLPSAFVSGVALFDYDVPITHDATSAAPATAPPRPVLLTARADVAAELTAAFARDADADADAEDADADTEHALWLLGACLHASASPAGVARAEPELLRRGATLAVTRGWVATLRALLPALAAAPPAYRAGLLRAAAASGDAAMIGTLLREGGHEGAFGDAAGALHAAALAAAASASSSRAVAGAAACAALTAHGGGALAWHTAQAALPCSSGSVLLTPAQVAARGGAPACIALCAALAARAAAAQAHLAALQRALPRRTPPGGAAARAALLSALPPPLLPGDAHAADEPARIADLARAMLLRATAAAAATENAQPQLPRMIDGAYADAHPSPRRALLALVLQAALPVVTPLYLARAAAWLHARPALTPQTLRDALLSGEPLPLRYAAEVYDAAVSVHVWTAAGVLLAAAALAAPRRAVRTLLAHWGWFVAFFYGIMLATQLLLALPGGIGGGGGGRAARWRMRGAPVEVLWARRVSALQVCVSATAVTRTARWRAPPAVLLLLLRAGLLALSAACPALELLPRTRLSPALVPMQVVALLAVAAAHVRRARGVAAAAAAAVPAARLRVKQA
jgi:hypothetical protein